jgi:hypothetical protein
VLGAASVTVGLGLLIYALGEGQAAGWASSITAALIAGSALCIAVFVIHEARSPDPLIALAVIRRRESAASVTAALQAATISAAVYLGSLYLQQVLGDSPERVGIATLPVPLGVAVGAYTVTRLLRHGRDSRFSGTGLIVFGFGLVAAALAWIGAEARAVASADGSALAGRLHGLQVATLGTSALALAAAALAGLTLPHGTVTDGPGSLAGEYDPDPGQGSLPVQAEGAAEN